MKAKIALIAYGVASVMTAVPAQAQLLGDTIACTRNGVSGCSAVTSVVGAGIEFNQSAGTFDFSDTGLTLILTPGLNVSPLIYAFADQTDPFTSFDNVMVSGGTFDTSRISLANGVLAFDLGGIDPVGGTTVTLNLSSIATAVPEPATWLMMIVGFGATGFALRRRSNSRTLAHSADARS